MAVWGDFSGKMGTSYYSNFGVLNTNYSKHNDDNIFTTVSFETRAATGTFAQINTISSNILSNLISGQSAIEFLKTGIYLLCLKFTNNSSEKAEISITRKNTASDAYETWASCKLSPNSNNDFVSPVSIKAGGRVYISLHTSASVSLYAYFIYLGP